MSNPNPHLPQALELKYGAVADTADGVITAWRHETLPQPNDTEIATAISEYDALQPLRDWKVQMAQTDEDMLRSTEDIYDALDEDAQGRVAQITRDRITAKKTLRGEKP